jgi:hypothetical protein
MPRETKSLTRNAVYVSITSVGGTTYLRTKLVEKIAGGHETVFKEFSDKYRSWKLPKEAIEQAIVDAALLLPKEGGTVFYTFAPDYMTPNPDLPNNVTLEKLDRDRNSTFPYLQEYVFQSVRQII